MKFIIGVDEAGRGPLAGPVAVGVAVVPGNFLWDKKLPGVTDSKQLSEKKREKIFMAARRLKAAGQINYAVALVSAKVIDKIGIVPAINLAIKRAFSQIQNNLNIPVNRYIYDDCQVLLDGGLKAPTEFNNQKTIIKGDSQEKIIGLASIVAKVTRDRYMVLQSSKPIFTPYEFATHKGYGTKKHRLSIAKCGVSSEHRQSYCKNLKLL